MNRFFADNDRVRRLIKLSLGIINKKFGKNEILKFSSDIDEVNPMEAITIIESVINASSGMDEKKSNISKILNVLHRGLSGHKWELQSNNFFLKDMRSENSYLKEELSGLKKYMREITGEIKHPDLKKKEMDFLCDKILKLKDMENHYLKKENIFFPYLEKKGGHLNCIPVMWSIHDDIRIAFKIIKGIRVKGEKESGELFSVIGELFFSMYAMIFREELILYPAAIEVFEEYEWENMYNESFDIGFSFIIPPLKRKMRKVTDRGTDESELIDLGTGKMDIHSLKLMLNHLPVDITFVDKNDRVVYFSSPEGRIFTRSKSIIGREVKNCHPPKSVKSVEKILKSFKNGSSTKESFRINYDNKYILIEYFAIRDSDGNYNGTLEVSMDITEINKLKGEKRLLADADS